MGTKISKDVKDDKGFLDDHDETELELADQPKLETELAKFRVWNGETSKFEWCSKNDKHENFISVNSFDLHHLPQTFRDEKFFETIKTLAKLTVKLKVKTLSDKRPEADSTKIRKIQQGEKYSGHIGSGRIEGFGFFSGCKCCDFFERSPSKQHFCPCKVCRNSTNPKREWGTFTVRTAKHVVYDDTEAYETEVSVFYDSEDTRDKVKTMSGYNILYTAKAELDKCLMMVVTHDKELWHQLAKVSFSGNKMYFDDFERFRKLKGRNCVIIISHPHGCPKQITIGEHVGRIVEHADFVDEFSFHLYTTPSCPGSSGGPCYMFGDLNDPNWNDNRVSIPPHRKGHSLKDKINASGISMVNRWLNLPEKATDLFSY